MGGQSGELCGGLGCVESCVRGAVWGELCGGAVWRELCGGSCVGELCGAKCLYGVYKECDM